MRAIPVYLFLIVLFVNTSTAQPLRDWTISFKGEGWEVQDVADHPELVKIGENQKHSVGIFISEKAFSGNPEDFISTVNAKLGKNYSIILLNGEKAVEISGPFEQDGQKANVRGRMFFRGNRIVIIQGVYQDDAGNTFLQSTLDTFSYK